MHLERDFMLKLNIISCYMHSVYQISSIEYKQKRALLFTTSASSNRLLGLFLPCSWIQSWDGPLSFSFIFITMKSPLVTFKKEVQFCSKSHVQSHIATGSWLQVRGLRWGVGRPWATIPFPHLAPLSPPTRQHLAPSLAAGWGMEKGKWQEDFYLPSTVVV